MSLGRVKNLSARLSRLIGYSVRFPRIFNFQNLVCRVEIRGVLIRGLRFMDLSLFLASAVASALATLLFVPWLIRNLRGTTLVGKDLNKLDRPVVPEMGGVGVLLGFSVGVTVITVLVTADTFATVSAYYYVAISASLGAGVVGLLDDMFHLRQRTKALLPFVLALPLGAVVFARAAITSTPPPKTQGAILFAPMIAEFVLKARSHFRAENYASAAPDGRLRYEGRTESITHVLLRGGRFREWEVVGILWAVEAAIAVALLLVVGLGLW